MTRTILVAALIALVASSAGAQLDPDNPNTALYGDAYLGLDGNGTPDATIGGIEIDFDGYVAAQPGETFIIHMLSNNMDGWPQAGSYRTAFWYDYNITTRGIERTDWSDTAGTFSNGPYVTDYTGYTMIDRYHGTNSQASIYTGLCLVSWEFTVLETAVVGSTMEIGLQFYTWHPSYAGGGRQYEFDANYGALQLEIIAPPAAPGDFNEDGDIDADDVDILCANMGGDLDPYDLNSDGVVDEDDMIFHIENLIEYDTDDDGTPDGQGTYVGDFDLNGVVNATDLQLMKGTFGTSGVGYANGNANCDTVVNATDLQILKGTFGSSVAGVPEPLTMSLLAIGGAALLRRRK